MLSWSDEHFDSGDQYAILKSYDGIDFMLIDIVIISEESDLWYQDFNTNFVAEDSYYKIQKQLGESILDESNIWKDQYLSRYQIHSYPTPSDDVINITFDLPLDHQVQVKIVDIFGNEVQSEVFEDVKAGNTNISMNLSELAMGQYIMLVDFGLIIKTKKISIVR